jgi:uncharacterized phage protein gp47/JayE
MASFKSLEEISLSLANFLRLVQPDLDTKPGSVARDILVDAPASEIAKLYGELRNVSNLQSFSTASGSDLDRLAKNIGLVRGTGSFARGTAVLTANDLSADIFIPANTLIASKAGVSFRTLSNVAMNTANSNVFRANALRLRSELDLAGISDVFAVEVGCEATSPGQVGNISRYGLQRIGISGVSNVTNLLAFTGGQGAETDQSFRARALGVFAGANLGTELGYRNTILSDSRVQDALTVSPGDPLMTRDGTQVGTDSDGNAIVISSGTGGKVDIYVQGTQEESISESFIYRDQSGKGDPTDPSNDIILGQRDINPLLDFQQRRRESFKTGKLPFQPVSSVVSISGSESGPNFIEKFTDSDGTVKGNFELIKDVNGFGGSPFGFDKVHFLSNKVTLESSPTSKTGFNSQDALNFSDVREISKITQDIVVLNEVPILDSTDRSLLTLKHTPVKSVTRVENITTGERYSIVSQNLDNSPSNTSGRIRISGSTLPVSTDIVQVSYIWDLNYDQNVDYDSLKSIRPIRTVGDSVDWGYANTVTKEEREILYSIDDGYHLILEHPISKVINVNIAIQESVSNAFGKLVLSNIITNVVSVKNADGLEVFNTRLSNGSFSAYEITLPIDTISVNGDLLFVTYNSKDIFSPEDEDIGTFSGSVIYLETEDYTPGTSVFVDYVANLPSILPSTSLSDLPADGYGNNFTVDSDIVGNQPITYHSTTNQQLRFAPSYLKMNFQGISSVGRVNVQGTSIALIETIVTVRRNSLTLDFSDAVKDFLKTSNIPSQYYLGKLNYVQRVTLSDQAVSSIDYEFDTLNYKVKNATYCPGEGFENSSLDRFSVQLSDTSENLENMPTVGQKLKISFYLINPLASENVIVSSSGLKFSAYKYLYISRISVSSGFVGLSGNVEGTLSIESFTQPSAGTVYFVTYSYIAPKEGERLVVNYNFNRLINDLSFLVERVRPITADVLIKAANVIEVDVSAQIVLTDSVNSSNELVRQNVIEAVSLFLSNGGLGFVVDASDIIAAIATVPNVDRVVLTTFNYSGSKGLRKTISADRSSYIVPGIISAEIEER